MSAPAWRTLRELDSQAGKPKGSAFRAFKRLEPGWREDEDYRRVTADTAPAEFEALRAAGRSYASSRVVVLLSDRAAAQIAAALAGSGPRE